MIVFKCYMKILRQNVTLVIIYLGYFLFCGSCHADGRWKK